MTKSEIVNELNLCIIELGQAPVRVDQMHSLGRPLTNVIQRLGPVVMQLQKEAEEEKTHEDTDHGSGEV